MKPRRWPYSLKKSIDDIFCNIFTFYFLNFCFSFLSMHSRSDMDQSSTSKQLIVFFLHFFIASGAAGGNIQTKFILRWWQSSGKCCIEPGPCWRNRIGCVHLPLLACGFENSKCYSMLNKIFLLDCCFIDTLLLNNSAVVADLFSVFLFCFCPF